MALNKGNTEDILVWVIVLLVAFLFFFAVPLASGNLGTFRQGDCISLRVLSNCSSVNMSEVTIGSNVYVSNTQMTNIAGQTFNYTFCNTSNLGTYSFSWNPNCVDCGGGGCGNSFDVTASGILQTTSQGIGSLSFMIIMFGLTALMGYLGFKFSESKALWILGIFFIFLAMLFVVYDVWLGYQYYLNYTGESNAGLPQTIFYIFMFVLVAGLLGSLALLFLRWRELARYIKDELKSKPEEDIDKDLE